MFEGLKEILGDAYTEEIDDKFSKLVGKGFVSKSDYNAKSKKVTDLEKAIADYETKIAGLQKTNVDAAEHQKEIDELKAKYAAEINQMKIDQIAFMKLVSAGAIDPEQAMLLLRPRLDSAQLGEDQKTVDGIDDWIKELTDGKGTAGMFSKVNGNQLEVAGAEPGNPGNKGEGAGKAPKDMSYDELCAYLEQNPNANLN